MTAEILYDRCQICRIEYLYPRADNACRLCAADLCHWCDEAATVDRIDRQSRHLDQMCDRHAREYPPYPEQDEKPHVVRVAWGSGRRC